MIYVDLMLDCGELVRIEAPRRFEDELRESIDNAMKRGDRWSVARFDGCRAEFMGVLVDSVNMRRVVALL